MQNLTESNFNRYRLRLLAVAVVVALGLVAAAVAMASGASGKHSTSMATVSTRKISGLGVVLVNAKGRTLYAFMKDAQKRVTCTGSCTSFWHPLKWSSTSKPTAGGTAKKALLSSDMNPSGGRVVTYNRWPLYTYVGDSAAGQAKGQAKTLNGGKWYVISPSGALIKHTASSGGGTTTGGGGGGWG